MTTLSGRMARNVVKVSSDTDVENRSEKGSIKRRKYLRLLGFIELIIAFVKSKRSSNPIGAPVMIQAF